MKRLKYDDSTHEIDIEEINNLSRIIKVRKKLETNKFFFEIISSILLATMSIIISVVGLNINLKTNEIYERQLKILDNDREPYFIVKSESIDGIFQGKDYNYTKKLYTIKNEGGLITGAYAFPAYTDIKIEIFNKGLEKRCTYILTYSGLFEDVDGENSSFLYDIEGKTFKFYIRESDKFNDFIHDLELELEKTFPPSEENKWMERIQISYDNKVEIGYINYKNIEFNQTYKIKSYDRITLISPEENVEAIFLGSANIEEDYRYIIQDVCKEIEESTSSQFSGLNHIRNPGLSEDEYKERVLDHAEHYLSSPHITYSKVRLIEILEEDGFIHEHSIHAIENCGADWNEQALKTAKNYLLWEPYSYNKLLEILVSVEKFTHEQAIYAVENCEVDWNEQARKRIEIYIHSNETNSYDELLQLLKDEGYTDEQAVYGIEHSGYQK